MKLSFSTRGWENLSWDDILDLAKEMKFSGIELYDIQKNEDLVNLGGPFNEVNTAETVRNLFEEDLKISCFDSSHDLSQDDENIIFQICELIEIAGNTRVPYISVFAKEDELEIVKKNLKSVLQKASENKVKILIKTSGIFSDTLKLRDILNEFASDYLAVLWDMHHPYRDNGETAAETIKNLGAYVKHVHIRDSDDDASFNFIGEGTVPMLSMMEALSSINYDGFISLEWKPEWIEDLNDPDIIFPHFINYMNSFSNPRSRKKELYYNFDHTGQYIWEKDILIDETFPELLDRVAEEFPDQRAIRYTTLDYTRTYSEFKDDVDEFAAALISLGVEPGSKVAVWATNVPEWFIAFWATIKIGAVLVTVNTAYKSHEVEYLLRQSDTHTLIMIKSCLDSNYEEIMLELCPELYDTEPGKPLRAKRLPFLRNIISVGFEMEGCLEFKEAMRRSELVPLEEVYRRAADVKPDDVCNMQYTSGTTGFPKGVMLTNYNIVNNGKAIGDRLGLSTADRMMIQVPMFHCFGMVLAMTASMSHGATICPLPYFSAKASLACINLERITCFHGVPTMFIAMFNHEDYENTDFSYMRTGIMAGAGCPADLMKRAASPEGMNMRGIVSVYGQTESSPGSTMSHWEDPLDKRCETVGFNLPHIECKIIDPETGEEVEDGENGEFCSRGYNTMKGYYKMPEETHDAVDNQGWLHSGDLACRTEDGYYNITGRLKDMIIRGGENIYPKEIEEYIYTNPKVKDVQVIGVPNEKYGEEIMACVILKDGEEMTEREMKEYIMGNMSRHKVPKHVVFLKKFPMNAAGKVQKYKMRENAENYLKGLGEDYE
ncbi:MAG: AMP-binding protein [Tissierellia bacterium]|nr:AMP-binding protein [Tissierellia bacterium]